MKVKEQSNGMILFWCPGCDCAHGINATWTYNGDELRPTFSPSILAHGPGMPRCHSFIQHGLIRFLADCDHKLAGQEVELPDWPFGGEK